METKISKIEDFLVSLEQNELTEQQSSNLLRAGESGSNNCKGGNCAVGCGMLNGICINFYKGCKNDNPGKQGPQ